ncbi:hypothetical protein MBLNU230_g4597t1 [Neophaeotheca triangularis]
MADKTIRHAGLRPDDDASSLEKPTDVFVERVSPVDAYVQKGLSVEDAEFLHSIDGKAADRIFKKVDVRLVPMLALLYLISHIDRANIGNAKLEGLEDSLNMTGNDYNVALSIFFIPYILAEVPSNLVLSRMKPSTWIGALVLAWGTVMTLTGVVQSFGGLLATRFFLGLTEAGFFPGAIYLVGQWYPPEKTQFRMACFYCVSAASGAFSGLLAAGIAQMDGVGGYEGWRWIFILEGIITVVIGAFTYFLLPDDPSSSSRWLNNDEIRYLELNHFVHRGLRKQVEVPGEKKRFSWRTLRQVLFDWQLYLQAMVFMSNAVPNYGLKFTMPQIIRNMGYSSANAQLLTAPPYALGAVSALVSAILADKFRWRMPFIVGSQSLLIVAYAILFSKAGDITNNVAVCYFAVFLACAGVYPIMPGCNAWTINNLAGPQKRAMGIAFMICVGNCGGIVGSYIFIDSEKPKYPTGFGSSLSFAAAGIICALTLEALYWNMNRRNAKFTEEEIRDKYTEEELEKMGDRSPLFTYKL